MSLGDKMERTDYLEVLPDEGNEQEVLCTWEWEAMINQSNRWNKKWSCFTYVCILLMFAGTAAAGDTGTIAKQVGKSATYYRALKGTANMPNLCLICFSAFISSAALAQHLIGKHSDLDCFECSHCGKTGKQKNNVQNYCIKRHKEIEFEINKINIDEVERFIQKYSFKGTKEEYDKTIKSKKTDIVSEKTHKKVAKIIKCSTYSVCNKHKKDCDCDNLTDNHTCSSPSRVESDCVVSPQSRPSPCVLTGYAVGQRAAVCDAEQTQELHPRARSLLYSNNLSGLKSHGIEVVQNKNNIITSRGSHSESQTQLNELVKSVWNVSDLMRKAISHKYEVPSSEIKSEPVLDIQSSAETLQQAHNKVVDGSDGTEIHMYDWMDKDNQRESSNIGLIIPNTIDARIKTLLSNKLGQFIDEVKLLTSL